MRTRLLGRYVLSQWLRVFLLTAIGLPFVSVLTNLTDNLRRMLDRDLTPGTIALSYLYALPENIALMIPAASLFAIVFTVGPLARNSELTAAKAGGISFHRLIFPLFVISALAGVGSFYLSEWATETTVRQLELQKEKVSRSLTHRFNFVYRTQDGWIYTIRQLDADRGKAESVVLERPIRGDSISTTAITADSASWDSTARHWVFKTGAMHAIEPGREPHTMSFAEMRVPALAQGPRELLVEPKKDSEMTYAELKAYISSLHGSGNDTRKLEVQLATKLAIPAACLIIALFGAPLAVSAPRAGAAVGIAISLGTTLAYLLMINLAQAVGASGLINPPALAAWVPNGMFLVVGLWLLARVRT
jgi:lipopolysaccharide export system permease protein